MTLETIRRAYSAQPFKPFTIYVADGRSLEVPHPEFMATAPNGRMIAVFDMKGDYHLIDLLLVTGLEIKQAATPDNSATS